jgi:hypothetical protein
MVAALQQLPLADATKSAEECVVMKMSIMENGAAWQTSFAPFLTVATCHLSHGMPH